MNIRSYIVLTLLLGGTLVQSCGTSYPDIESPDEPNREHGLATPVSVFLSEQDLFSVIATRGTGAWTESSMKRKIAHGLFEVFAFRDSVAGAMLHTAADDARHDFCLVDGSRPYHGKAARLEPDGTGTLRWVSDADLRSPDTLYYSNDTLRVPYTFSAYYLDDFEPTADSFHRLADEIYCDVTLDGARDLLVGTAPRLTPEVLSTVYKGIQLNEAERRSIVSVGGYSAYAARFGLHPVVKLRHALPRLRFEVVPADSTAGQTAVTGIFLIAPDRGRLTVASADASRIGFVPSAHTDTLRLREASADGVVPGRLVAEGPEHRVAWRSEYAGRSLDDLPGQPVGESLMPASAESYVLGVDYVVTDAATGRRLPQRSAYVLRPSQVTANYDEATRRFIFRPGHEYTIKIGVYGQAGLRVSTTLGAWQEAGTVVIDREAQP